VLSWRASDILSYFPVNLKCTSMRSDAYVKSQGDSFGLSSFVSIDFSTALVMGTRRSVGSGSGGGAGGGAASGGFTASGPVCH